MTSEHHGGFAGYLPNPLQLAGFCLDAMPHGWAAPCPLLLPLRPPALVAEEIAWLAARFPGRVGLGVAAGALPVDFEIMDVHDGRPHRAFRRRARGGRGDAAAARDPGALAGDPAIAACAEHPIPVLSAAMGFTAVRRGRASRRGLLFDSLSTPERCRELVDAYREAGGDRSGRPDPARVGRRAAARARSTQQLDVYRELRGERREAALGRRRDASASDEPNAVVDDARRRARADRGRRAEPPRARAGRHARARRASRSCASATKVLPKLRNASRTNVKGRSTRPTVSEHG